MTWSLPPGVRLGRLRRDFRTARRGAVAVVSIAAATSVLAIPASRATAVADEIHYSFTSQGSVTFDWRGTASDIRFGTTTSYGTIVLAQTPDPAPFSSPDPYWEAKLTGLRPGAVYHYSIGGGPDATFRAVPTGSFRFDVEADVGDSAGSAQMLPIQQQIAADDPAFVLVPGDLTYGDNHGQDAVDQHFNDVMVWSRTASYIPTWGNHEWDQPTYDDLRNYKGRFAIAHGQASVGAPAPGCCGEDWGWFDAGGVRFISYPEPYTTATWPDWGQRVDALMADAQADPSIHFIATFGHRSAYSTGHHVGNPNLSSIIDGLGARYSKYVVNFSAHSHDYERFSPINGVVHIVSGGGGALLEPPWLTTDDRIAFRAMHHEYLRVDVTATAMVIEAVCGPSAPEDDVICAQGTVIDSTRIVDPQELVENPSFETDTSGWRATGGPKIALARLAGGHDGAWAASIRNGSRRDLVASLDDDPNWAATTTAGTYAATVWVRTDWPGMRVILRLREMQGGTVIGSRRKGVALSAEWQRLRIQYVPTSPGSSSISLDVRGRVPARTGFLVDDVSETVSAPTG